MPKQSDLSWTRIVFFVFIHIAAIVGLLQTTPNVYALSLFALFFIGSGGLAFQICLHRYFAHRSFKTIKPVEYLFSWLVSINFQGGVARWVANHKIHHQKADRKGDLHGAIEISKHQTIPAIFGGRQFSPLANGTTIIIASLVQRVRASVGIKWTLGSGLYKSCNCWV